MSLRSVKFFPWLLAAAMICFPACSGEGGRKSGMESAAPGKKEVSSADLSLNDATLYTTDIWEIDRTYREEGVFRVIGELRGRAGKKDARALSRLVELLLTSDGYVTEGIVIALAPLFEADPEFFLDHTWQMEKEVRDLAYKAVIHENYYARIFEKAYPLIWDDLKKMGAGSGRFRNMYEYYIANPEHLEDWSVDPPE